MSRGDFVFTDEQILLAHKVVARLNNNVSTGIFSLLIIPNEIEINYECTDLKLLAAYYYVDEHAPFPDEMTLVDDIAEGVMKKLRNIIEVDDEVRSSLGWED